MKEKKIKISKKGGADAEQFLEVFLAVVALLLIMGVVFMLYKAFSGSEATNAKKTLEYLEGKINYINNGQSGKFMVQGFKGASNWIIEAWEKDGAYRPDKCFFKGCLCICPVKPFFSSVMKRSEICQEEGFCRTFETDNIESSMEDVLFSRYLSGYENVKEDFNIIVLEENVIEIEINKSKDFIEIKRIL